MCPSEVTSPIPPKYHLDLRRIQVHGGRKVHPSPAKSGPGKKERDLIASRRIKGEGDQYAQKRKGLTFHLTLVRLVGSGGEWP